ncbi:hypothetical protein [Paenibacillus agricola]|uniref:Uncharacterized protein n=1 Tax=Paenibacillus agricola TaxID=2716264 RepID=A0ABX0JEA1_9BACL|nr:hypothetical protein [Paenibacillus agricola]NHN34769.1 hypothetical protein [Paenibacillus agricola]
MPSKQRAKLLKEAKYHYGHMVKEMDWNSLKNWSLWPSAFVNAGRSVPQFTYEAEFAEKMVGNKIQ